MCVLHLPRMHPIAPTISPWLQVPSSSWGYHSLMFLAAEFAPRLAALLVTSGHLQAMTEAVEGLDASLVPDMVSGSAPASASPFCGFYRQRCRPCFEQPHKCPVGGPPRHSTLRLVP